MTDLKQRAAGAYDDARERAADGLRDDLEGLGVDVQEVRDGTASASKKRRIMRTALIIGVLVIVLLGIATTCATAATLYVIQPVAEVESCEDIEAETQRLIDEGVITAGTMTVCSDESGT